MFGRLMPKEGKFFELFNAHAEQLVIGGQALLGQFTHLGTSPESAEAQAEQVDAAELRADKITHETIALLHKTFITPLDRDEIHQLITRLDDILDTMQDAAEVVSLYDIQRSTPEARQLAELSVSCCERVKIAVGLLEKARENGQAILKTCEEINRLESDADRVMRSAMSRLFRDESDVREVMKQKAVYEHLETVTDRCKDVANILEGIVLENS